MFAVGVDETFTERWKVKRCLMDVLGLLEGVSHGGREAVTADGTPGHDDLEPSPEANTAVSGEVAEGHLDGLRHGMDASRDVTERVLGHTNAVDGQATNLLKTGHGAGEFKMKALKSRIWELAQKASFAMSDVPKALMKSTRKARANCA